jgi:uncharacterized membrane protein YbhN (UPF0104 family)
LRAAIKPLLGLLLLAIALSQLELERLKETWVSADLGWFVLAIALGFLANLCCAMRWRRIINHFHFSLPGARAVDLYFQGVAANTVLPGGIIGGDIWRAASLAKLTMPKFEAAQTVIFDRLSGLWSLTWLSLASLLATFSSFNFVELSATSKTYCLLLLLTAIGPAFLFWMPPARVKMLLKLAPVSLLAQGLSLSCFLSCTLSAGINAPALEVVVFCAGIFLGAALPASIGGFGSRELASIFFLANLGVSAETAFLGSVLFGLTATLQGLTYLITSNFTRPVKL